MTPDPAGTDSEPPAPLLRWVAPIGIAATGVLGALLAAVPEVNSGVAAGSAGFVGPVAEVLRAARGRVMALALAMPALWIVRRVTVEDLRVAVTIVTLLALAGIATMTLLTARADRDHLRRIEAQYGALIASARIVRRPDHVPLVAVQRFEQLAAVAQAQGAPILRDESD